MLISHLSEPLIFLLIDRAESLDKILALLEINILPFKLHIKDRIFYEFDHANIFELFNYI